MKDVKTVVAEAQEAMSMAVEYLEDALAHIRAGKADVRLLDGIKVNSHKMRHPGDAYAFSFEYGGKKFVYATDVELKTTDYQNSTTGEGVFRNADAIVIDSQYTVEEVYRKENWGHSSFCYAIDFAVYWGIKNVYLFHHEPVYDDKKLNSILEAARWYAQYINHSDIKVYLAKESQEIIL